MCVRERTPAAMPAERNTSGACVVLREAMAGLLLWRRVGVRVCRDTTPCRMTGRDFTLCKATPVILHGVVSPENRSVGENEGRSTHPKMDVTHIADMKRCAFCLGTQSVVGPGPQCGLRNDNPANFYSVLMSVGSTPCPYGLSTVGT